MCFKSFKSCYFVNRWLTTYTFVTVCEQCISLKWFWPFCISLNWKQDLQRMSNWKVLKCSEQGKLWNQESAEVVGFGLPLICTRQRLPWPPTTPSLLTESERFSPPCRHNFIRNTRRGRGWDIYLRPQILRQENYDKKRVICNIW